MLRALQSRRPLALATVLLAAAVLAAGCGGSSKSASMTTTTTSAALTSATTAATSAASRSVSTHTTTSAAKPSRSSPAMSAASRRALRNALAAYAACMRGKGIQVPPPRETAAGPRLSGPKGIKTTSRKFAAALRGCAAETRRVFRLAEPGSSAQ